MSTITVKVPDIGDFDKVEVIEVLVSVGDSVAVEDTLLTLESDKATMDIPAEQAGKVTEIKVSAGEKVGEGDVILTLEADESGGSAEEDKPASEAPKESSKPEARAAAEKPAKQEPAPRPPAAPAGKAPDHERFKSAHASPSIRRFARELGVDLSQVSGSGPKNRILKEDVQGFVKQALSGGAGAAASAAGGAGIPSIPAQDFSKFGAVELRDLPRIRKLSAAHLHRCWLNIPHVTQFDSADITDLEDFRKTENGRLAKSGGGKITPLAFIIKACANALRKFPEFNSSLAANGEQLVMKQYVHIGFAADTPNGLVVPVIRDADQKSVLQLAAECGELAGKARDGKLKPADMSGGCFSISSLGGIGGTAFTPIVNAPEVAILGVSKSKIEPLWQDGAFQPRLMLPLSLSYDHRVIDGAAAARFTDYLGQLLGDTRRMLL